mmetsp:Transcript_19638/g.43712  ORF Transcript_19638/g.43712 Transcript_19638/m.43712 type:complete len:122 (+) Transcript_19638:2499-2864(+)
MCKSQSLLSQHRRNGKPIVGDCFLVTGYGKCSMIYRILPPVISSGTALTQRKKQQCNEIEWMMFQSVGICLRANPSTRYKDNCRLANTDINHRCWLILLVYCAFLAMALEILTSWAQLLHQ